MGYNWPCRVQGYFGVIQCTCLKMACISKTAGHKAKQSNVGLGIWGTFDLVGFNVILGSFGALSQNWLSKLADCRAKWTKICDLCILVTYMGYIWPCRVQGHFGVIRYTCLKMTCISKTAGHRAKRTEIWDSGILVVHIWGIFDLVGFKVIWCNCLKIAWISKTTGCRAKWTESWDLWMLVTHMEYIWLSRVQGPFEGHSLHLSQKILPVSQKRLVIEQNGVKFGTRGY